MSVLPYTLNFSAYFELMFALVVYPVSVENNLDIVTMSVKNNLDIVKLFCYSWNSFDSFAVSS